MIEEKAIKAIDTILESGYDVEIRKTKFGVTVASVGKKVIYKENSEKNETENSKKVSAGI